MLLTFFDNFNFQNTLFSKMMVNFFSYTVARFKGYSNTISKGFWPPLCSEIDQLWFFGFFWHFLANFLLSLGESKNGFGDSSGDIRPDVRIRQWVWIWRRISTAPQKEVLFDIFFKFSFFKISKFLILLLYFSRFSSPGPALIAICLSLLIDEKVARFCIKKFRLIRISHC